MAFGRVPMLRHAPAAGGWDGDEGAVKSNIAASGEGKVEGCETCRAGPAHGGRRSERP